METMFINLTDENFRYGKIKTIEVYLCNIALKQFSKTFYFEIIFHQITDKWYNTRNGGDFSSFGALVIFY